MPSQTRDILTQQYDYFLPTSREFRFVDLQPDPNGGYFALIDAFVPPNPQLPNPPPLLSKLDNAYSVVWTKTIDIIDTGLPEFKRLRLNVSGMTVGPQGVFIVGTFFGHSFIPRPTAFVAKFGLDGTLTWIKRFSALLVDGCQAPSEVNTFGRSIVRLPPPDDDRMLLMVHTAHSFDGVGMPAPTDALSAAVLPIDNDGNRLGLMTRLFGYGHAIPERLRVLPGMGPTIVGRTRVIYPRVEPWLGWIAMVDRNGFPLDSEGWIGFGPDVAGVIYDIAEGPRGAVAVGVLAPAKGHMQAFAAGVINNPLATWIAQYDPPVGTEFFRNDLYQVRPVGDSFIAAGDYDVSLGDPAGMRRPWLLRLTADDPAPVWQKAYNFSEVRLPTSFHCLWIRPDGVALAGGNMSKVTIRIPFLAVSETEATIDDLKCSQATRAIAVPLPKRTGIINSIYDRMPAFLLDIASVSSNWNSEMNWLCAQE